MLASADERDSAKSFSAALLIWILLCHSAPQICHSTLLWMVRCYLCLSAQLSMWGCVSVASVKERERGRCTPLSFVIPTAVKSPWVSEKPSPTLKNEDRFSLQCPSRQEKNISCVGVFNNGFQNTLYFVSWSEYLFLASLPYIRASQHWVSVSLRGTKQTECDRGIFQRLVVWRRWIESRSSIFCPSKLSPLYLVQRRLPSLQHAQK